mmetsp:Transcript_9108/g.27304  ORF Transcript_9108/g.27304 Transcript_9108/m.27304 type:complete len:82 (-) Transcript_9108:11-256(-)
MRRAADGRRNNADDDAGKNADENDAGPAEASARRAAVDAVERGGTNPWVQHPARSAEAERRAAAAAAVDEEEEEGRALALC